MTKWCALFVLLTLLVSLSLAEEPITPPTLPLERRVEVPILRALSPSQAMAGSASFTLKIAGSNFCSQCVVLWNGSRRPTTVLNSTSATVTISATELAQAGSNHLLMINTLSGEKSNALQFLVVASAASSSPSVSIVISPTAASLQTGNSQQFSASVGGTINTAVTWSATGGTISSTGMYTAPSTAGSYVVTATSSADTSKAASAAVTVNAAPVVAVTISPTSVSLLTGGTQQFSATVTGSSNTAVTWSVTGGSVSSTGLYTAPTTAGTYTVKATSVADTTKSASATVTVSAAPVVAISISPTSASMLTGGTQQFTATVTGSSNTAVTWSATGGSVSSSGLYTAPSSAGTYTVTATSAADTTKSASATVTVSAPVVALSISPTSASMLTGGTQQFTATVTGSSNTAVTWSAAGGSVSSSGLYTAPSSAGTYTVTATSVADTTKSASATVTVSVVAISISPTSVSLLAGGTQQFTPTVTGTTNTVVNWSATSGTISYMGYYTAPSSAGTYTVTATSAADPTKSASATVTVSAPVAVSISPTSASLSTGGTQQFTATVTGSTNTAVAWSVSGSGGSGGGTPTPVDMYIPLANATVGEQLTPSVMEASGNVYPSTTTWTNPSGYATTAMTVAAHAHSLPGAISIGGDTYTASSSSQAIAYNDSVPQDTLHYIFSGSDTHASMGMWITVGPAGGTANDWELYDWFIFWDQTGDNYACFETFIGGPTGSGGNLEFSIETKTTGNTTTHTSAIDVTQGSTYWVTMKADWVAQTAYLNVYDTSSNLVGSVTGSMTNSSGNYLAALDIGNQELGVQSGNTTYFENIIIDTTNASFPLLPSAGSSAGVGSITSTGLYTAPSTAGTYTVTATSVADTTKSASATVTVSAP